MRSLRKSWIGIVLIILFGLSLFFWKQSTVVSNIFNSDNVVAKVGNTKISTTRFNRGLQLNINSFNNILKKELSSEEIINYQIHQLALGAIINETVFENEFNNLGLKLDEKIIAKKTKELIPNLYSDNNELNEDYLNNFLSQQKLKIEDIIQILHYEARNDYYNSAFLNINIPKSSLNKINTFNAHTRNIDYLKIPLQKIDLSKKVKENENNMNEVLSNFYKDNISDYMSKEKRELQLLRLQLNDFVDNFKPTKNEILKYYNNNKELYFENEKRSYLQFNFKEQNDAKNFRDNIENISSYEGIIKYVNENSIEFNNFENIEKDEILEIIADPLFKLKINEKTSVFKSPLAYHVLFLKKIKNKKQLSFDDVEESINKEISYIDAKNFFIDLENQISQDILDGLNLKEISEKNNLNLLFIDDLTNDFNKYDQKDNKFFVNLFENAFNSSLNFTNDIVKLDEDEFYTFELKKIIESEPINFAEIKEDVLKNWKIFKKLEFIDEKITSNKNNTDFIKTLENEYNEKIQPLEISFKSKNIPNDLNKYIFISAINDINYIVEDDLIHISKLKKVNMNNSNIINDQQDSLSEDIRNSVYNELLKKTKISTNDNLINAILKSL
tara:strand:- start:10450 stop:12294 length:1845 start_codon:yes stop_codon:yes gene_type:complete